MKLFDYYDNNNSICVALYPLCLSMDEGIETAFLGTRSGLMRFQRYNGIERRVAK